MKPNAVPFEIRTAAAIEIPSPLGDGKEVQNEVLELGEGDFGTGDNEEQSPAEIEFIIGHCPAHGGPVGGIVDVTGPLAVRSLTLGDEFGIDRDVALPALTLIKNPGGQSSLVGEAQANVTRRRGLGDDLAVALEVPDTTASGGAEETSVQEYVGLAHKVPHLVRAQHGFDTERYGALSECKFGTDHNPQGLLLHLSGVEVAIPVVGEVTGQSSITGNGVVGSFGLIHPDHPLAA